jgi:hypothetical protein
MNIHIELVHNHLPSIEFQQDIFRFVFEHDHSWTLRLALKIPCRRPEDSKPASKRQRDALTSFFWGVDLLPEDLGWQQAGRLMDMRALAFMVAETMEDGFFAANRTQIAPMIASYISQSTYLSAIARGWNLGSKQGSATSDGAQWRTLIASPFYRELLEFGLLAREDLNRPLIVDD